MQYKMIQKTQWQAQKIGVSYKCFGQQYKDFVVFYIAFVVRPQFGFYLGFSKLYSKLSVVKYNVIVKFGTNFLELTPWKFTPFGFFHGSVVNYKLLRASYKSMEPMEIIFHSECQPTPPKLCGQHNVLVLRKSDPFLCLLLSGTLTWKQKHFS